MSYVLKEYDIKMCLKSATKLDEYNELKKLYNECDNLRLISSNNLTVSIGSPFFSIEKGAGFYKLKSITGINRFFSDACSEFLPQIMPRVLELISVNLEKAKLAAIKEVEDNRKSLDNELSKLNIT